LKHAKNAREALFRRINGIKQSHSTADNKLQALTQLKQKYFTNNQRLLKSNNVLTNAKLSRKGDLMSKVKWFLRNKHPYFEHWKTRNSFTSPISYLEGAISHIKSPQTYYPSIFANRPETILNQGGQQLPPSQNLSRKQ
jgi:hypothetical protein